MLKVEVPSPPAFEELFKEINHQFPDLSFYDVDIPLILRYAAAFGVFPLAYCKVEVEQGWNISSITALLSESSTIRTAGMPLLSPIQHGANLLVGAKTCKFERRAGGPLARC